MCLSEKSLTESCGAGTDGDGGKMGSSRATLDAARNERRSEAVTREGESQTRRMLELSKGKGERRDLEVLMGPS